MQKNRVYILVTLIILCVFFMLSGCSKTEKAPETIVLDAVYEKELLTFDESFSCGTGIMDLIDTTLYVCGRMESNICIAAIDRQSNDIDYLKTEVSLLALGFCRIDNGYAVISESTNNITYESQYILYVISGNGEITEKIDVSPYIREDNQIYMWADNNDVYFINGNNCAKTDTGTGLSELLFEISSVGELVSVTVTAKQPVFLIRNKYGKQVLYYIDDFDNLTENKSYNADHLKTASQVFISDDSYLLIYNNQGIYISNETDISLMLDWTHSNISKDGIVDFITVDENSFFMLYRNFTDNETDLYYLKPISGNQTATRTVIRVSYSESGAKTIPQAALSFNAQSDKYFVICDEIVTVFNETEYEYTTQLSEFDKLILNGNIGDVVVFNTEYEKYIDKNVFLDLYTFLENDDALSKDDLFTCVTDSLEYNECLYLITPYFRIKTLVGKENTLPNGVWNDSLLIEYANSLSENQKFIAVMNYSNLTDVLLNYNIDTYINFENHTCDFTNDSFISLLKYLYELPETTELPKGINNPASYQQDIFLTYKAMITNIADLLSVKVRFGIDENLNFIGYPSQNGGRSIVLPYDYYAISVDTAVGDGAWEFIKFLLSENVVLSGSNFKSYIPTMKSVFDKWIEVQKSYIYTFEYDSTDYIAKLESTEGSGGTYSLETTDELIEEFETFINNINVKINIPLAVSEIINEEINIYYSGAKTAEETAKIIQNRVSIYLSENR